MGTIPIPIPIPTPITANGQQVAVGVKQIVEDPRSLTFELTATVGQTVYTYRHTVGAISGQIAAYTPATLQAEIDGVKQAVADFASKLEMARLAASQLK